eukprot:gene24799-28030_t
MIGLKVLLLFLTSWIPCGGLHTAVGAPSLRSERIIPRETIVDIFFIFAEMPGFAFVHKQYYWVLPSVAAMLVKSTTRRNAADSEVRIHILSDTQLVLQKAKSLGYYTYDLLPYVDKHNKFLDRVSLTVNGTANELTFFRWKVLNRIVTEWNRQTPENPVASW